VYSIEILPPALKKQRTLRERTVFVGLSAALAVALLGHDAWTSRADTLAAQRNVSQLQSEYRSRERRAKDFEELTGARDERAVRIELLEERVTPGVGLSRTMLLLQRYLPPELYVRSVAIARVAETAAAGTTGAHEKDKKDKQDKKEPRPVIEVKGEGREGAMGLEQMFSTFAQQLAADPLLPRGPQTSTRPAGAKNPFEWTVVLDFASASPGEDAGAETSSDESDQSDEPDGG
jgi:hypothetical protein